MASQTSQFQTVSVLNSREVMPSGSSVQTSGTVKLLTNGYVDQENGNFVSGRGLVTAASNNPGMVTAYGDGVVNDDRAAHYTHGGIIQVTNYLTPLTKTDPYVESRVCLCTRRCIYTDGIPDVTHGSFYLPVTTPAQTKLVQLITVPNHNDLAGRIRLRPKDFYTATVIGNGATITLTIVSGTTYNLAVNGVAIGGGPFTMGVSTHAEFDLVFENGNTGYTVADVFEWRVTNAAWDDSPEVLNLNYGLAPVFNWWVRYGNNTYIVGPNNMICGVELVRTGSSLYSWMFYSVGSRVLQGTGLYIHEGHLFVLDAVEQTGTNQYIKASYKTPTASVVYWSDLNSLESFYPTLVNEADLKVLGNTKNTEQNVNYLSVAFTVAFRTVSNFSGVFSYQGQLLFETNGVLWRASYVGLPLVYSFVSSGVGYLVPNSLISTRFGVFALTTSDVVTFNGVTFEPVKNILGILNVVAKAVAVPDTNDVVQPLAQAFLTSVGFDESTQALVWVVHPRLRNGGTQSVVLRYQLKTKTVSLQYVNTCGVLIPFNQRNTDSDNLRNAQRYTYAYFYNATANPYTRYYQVDAVTNPAESVVNTSTLKLVVHPFCVAQNLQKVRELTTMFLGVMTNWGVSAALGVVTGTLKVYSSNRMFNMDTTPSGVDVTTTTQNISTTTTDFLEVTNMRVSGRFFGFELDLSANYDFVVNALEINLSRFDADK